MYDVVEPKEIYNLHRYILETAEVIKKISSEGKVPILVGGTGLYLRSILDGISDFGTEADKVLRSELENLEIDQIRKKIERKDPDILIKLNNSEIHNKRRLIRIFEKLLMGPSKQSCPGIGKDFDVLKIGLKTDMGVLDRRIKERVIKRIKEGMIEESEKLLARKLLSYQRMDQLGLEYRYIAKYLKGEIKDKEELVEILSLKIRQFAKRQITWFKKEKEVSWFDISEKDCMEKAVGKVKNPALNL
jgi:tRNA dimethylallyltransferase